MVAQVRARKVFTSALLVAALSTPALAQQSPATHNPIRRRDHPYG